jgi:hypothetical protein
MLFKLYMFLRSMYYPTCALCDTVYVMYTNSYTVWHLGAILMELLHQGIQTNLLVYVLFILISIIKTLDC